MKKLLAIVILSLCFIVPSKADDIRDFQVEGITVGESLLNFLNEDEILQNIRDYGYKDDTYFVTNVTKKKYLKTYDVIEIYLKKNDKNYTVMSVDASVYYEDKKKCLSQMDSIQDNFSDIVKTKVRNNKKKYIHYADTSNKSIYYRTDWDVNNLGFIAIECVFWSQKIKDKHNWDDHLRISITKKDLNDWLLTQ